jgi:hypothetical protein
MEEKIKGHKYRFSIHPVASRRKACCKCGEPKRAVLIRFRRKLNSDVHICHNCLIDYILADEQADYTGDYIQLAVQVDRLAKLKRRNFRSDGTPRTDALKDGLAEYQQIRSQLSDKIIEALDNAAE